MTVGVFNQIDLIMQFVDEWIYLDHVSVLHIHIEQRHLMRNLGSIGEALLFTNQNHKE